MENTEWKKKIFSSLDLLSGTRSIDSKVDLRLLELIRHFHGDKMLDEICNSPDIIADLVNYYIAPPIYIYDFLNNLINREESNSVFDPWLNFSSPSIHLQFNNTTGICMNHNELNKINAFFTTQKMMNISGNPLIEIENLSTLFDLVISFPPFGSRTENINGIKSSFDLATTLILKSNKLLKEKGKMVFLLSDSFLINDKTKEVIADSDLFIDSVFSVHAGAFAPMTNIHSNIIILTKEKKDKMFLAEISQDENINKVIIQNYKNRKEGKAIQLGSLVNISDFKTFQALVTENKILELTKRLGYSPVLLSDLYTNIRALNENVTEEVLHLSNSIYLPKVGKSPVVSSISEMRIKPKNYFQIQLDETKANAIYVANYFNTQIGMESRKSLEIGSVIQYIPKSQLNRLTVYNMIELDIKIQQFNLRLDELRRNLWKQPKSYKNVAKELKIINKEDRLENWIDTLPFPISSILWRYYATKENSKKIEHLFHYFEAFSEFTAMIMLSALVSDKEFYRGECYKWIDTDIRFQNWYLKATFGNWNILNSRLSKTIREYLSDKEKSEYCKSLFGNPSETFLDMITSKRIINVLFDVAEIRNKWKGHGGITSEDEAKQRVITLEIFLNELRKNITDAFEETRMLSPTTSSYEDGIFTFNAKELVGSRTPFNEVSIKSRVPLDKNKLYLAHNNQDKPLELIPFIKYIEASDAIYFYTSIESRNVRWVSYHFEKESELQQPADDELFKVFDFLKK